MTSDELREHFARIAAAQDRTDAQMAENAAQMAKTDARLDRLAEMTAAQQAENAAQMAKTDARLDRLAEMTAAQMAETDAKLDRLAEMTAAQMAETDAKLDRLAEKLKELAKMYGGVGNNQGAVAEEFFYNSLEADPVLGGVRFDSVRRNVPGECPGLEDEFDLVLVNGREVLVVEVKYKAHESDLWSLLDETAPNFRRLFPQYADHEHRFALASFHIHDELKRAALDQGVTVLQRKGDVIEATAAWR